MAAANKREGVEYRPVPGFTLLRASSLGCIETRRGYRGTIRPEWKRVAPRIDSRGYVSVHVRIGEKRIEKRVHTLVLLAFVGPRPQGMQGCHNNGDPTDNRLDNLRWDSLQSNINDRGRHGRHANGERNGRAKLRESEVAEIKRMLSDGCSRKQIMQQFALRSSRLCAIAKGRIWSAVRPADSRQPATPVCGSK